MRSVAIALLAASSLLADDIELKSGGRISGMIREDNGSEVVVETITGTVKISKNDIAAIDKKARSPVQDFYDKLNACKAPEDFTRLAEWADDLKLTRLARDARSKAAGSRRKEFDEALKALPAEASADQLYDLGMWAKKYGLEAEAKAMLERAVLKNPDHELARRELGFKRFENKWLTEDEVMLAKGLVKYEGQWITESQRELIVSEKTAKFKEREKKVADAERRLAERESQVSQREAALKKEQAAAEAEEVKIKQIERRTADREAALIRTFGDPNFILPCPTCKIWYSRQINATCPFCAYKKDHK